jgi:hypothetical protein
MNQLITKRWHRLLRVLLPIALMICVVGTAAAADEVRINIERANPSGGVLQLIFYSAAEETPTPETLQVSLDGVQAAVSSVDTIDYADPGTSYLFLFDTNTAVTERAIPDMQRIAKSITKQFGTLDNALIVPVGGEIDKKAFSDDTVELDRSIDSLTRGTEASDLYTSISNAIKLLESDETLRPRRCLVVMADGLDNTADGVSALEVSTLVSQGHVPVYVVALTYNTKTEERIQAAKDISGIARLSPGGVSILLKNDGSSTQDAVDTILAQRAKTYLAVIKAEAVRAATQADQVEITLTLTTKQTQASATRRANLSGLVAPTPAETPAPEQTTQSEEPPLPDDAIEGKKADQVVIPAVLLYAAGAVVAVVIVAALVLHAAKRRHNKTAAHGAVVRFADAPIQKKALRKQHPVVCIIRLGEKEEILHEGTLREKILLGEGGETPILPKNTKKGIQTMLVSHDGAVWAIASKQGVLINGKEAQAKERLKPGDVLEICGVDYRIFYSTQA